MRASLQRTVHAVASRMERIAYSRLPLPMGSSAEICMGSGNDAGQSIRVAGSFHPERMRGSYFPRWQIRAHGSTDMGVSRTENSEDQHVGFLFIADRPGVVPNPVCWSQGCLLVESSCRHFFFLGEAIAPAWCTRSAHTLAVNNNTPTHTNYHTLLHTHNKHSQSFLLSPFHPCNQ